VITGMLLGAAIALVFFLLGRLLPGRRKGPKPVEALCGCKHHHALHSRVKCGLRADLPKKERRHDWVPLGLDTRNRGSRGFLDCEISACRACGTDKAVTP
jgi:hypothetical protein